MATDTLTLVNEVISKWGGYLGTASAGAAGYVFKRFQAAEKAAKSAHVLAKKLREDFDDFETKFSDLKIAFDTLRQTLEARFSADRTSQPSRVETEGLPRRFEDLQARLDEIRASILQERGARHALQKEFNDYVKGEAEQWRDLHRALGKIEGRLERFLSRT